MRVLRNGLKDIEKEVEYQKASSLSQRYPKFITVMNDFLSVASYNFSELDDQFNEAKNKVRQ
jgi:dishevelled associated activator of morphogenesis